MPRRVAPPGQAARRRHARAPRLGARGQTAVPDFREHPDWLTPQRVGPWAVLDPTLGKAMYAGSTLGGMRTTVDGEVQRPDGSVAPGLSAAGACASDLARDGKGCCSGTRTVTATVGSAA